MNAVRDLLTELWPEVVITHSPDDVHPDHVPVLGRLPATAHL